MALTLHRIGGVGLTAPPPPTASGRPAIIAAATAVGALLLLACAGGFLFRSLEREAELESYSFNRALYKSITDSVEFEHCKDPAFKEVGFCRRHEELEERLRRFFSRAGNSLTDQRLWTWLGSFFFVIQVGSTVGYASQVAPQTAGGQLAAIAFGTVTIPLAACGAAFAGSPILEFVERFVPHCMQPSGDNEGTSRRFRLACLGLVLVVVLWPGAALFFSVVEGWSYANSLFFCFVTLTTVGFGTDMPSFPAARIFCMIYIFLALSLAAGFLQKVSGLPQQQSESEPLMGRPLSKLLNPLVCLLLVAMLCLVGAMLLPTLERQQELERYDRARHMFEDLNELAQFSGCQSSEVIASLDFCQNAELFKAKLRPFFGPDTPNSIVDRESWTPFGAASFVLSLASTVGYGAHSPHTRDGKIAAVLIGLVAIPLFLQYMLGSAAVARALFAQKLSTFRNTGSSAGGVSGVTTTSGPVLLALLILVAAIWLAGGLVFWILESDGSGWSFTDGLYFCFVTLSGVGFSNVMPQSLIARVFSQVYVVIGLGAVASLLSSLADWLYEVLANMSSSNSSSSSTSPRTRRTSAAGTMS